MLAQLPTHLNICRFYHAWLEPDWASMDSEPRTRVANDLGLNDFGVGVAAAASTPTNCQQTPSQRSMNQSCNNNLWSNTASASAASPPSIRFAEYNGAPGASTAPIDALNDGWDRATATQSDPAVMTDSTAMSVLDSTGVIRRNSSFQNARSVFGPPKPAAPPIKGNIHCCCCLGCDDNHVCAVPKIPTIVSPTNSSVKSDAAKLARRHKSSEDDGGFDFSQWGQGDDAEEEEDQGDENSESESDDSETSLESKPVAQPPIKPALGGVVPDEAARLSASSPPPLTSPSGPQSPSFNTTPGMIFWLASLLLDFLSLLSSLLAGDQSTIRIDLEKTDGSFSPGSFYLQSSSTTRYVDRSKSASSAAAGNAKRQLPMTTEQISSPAASPLLSALPPSADASKSDTAACSPALKSTSNSALAVQNQQLPVYYAALAHLSKTMRFPVRLYIQMQLCESDTLATWLQNRNRRVNTEYSMRLWTQIVEGVRHMHAHGIVHRDIKPGNLFVEAVRPFAPPPSASPAVGARRQVSAASTTRAQVRLADSETEDSFSQPSSAPTSLAPSPMLPVARPHTSPGLWSLNSMQVEQASPALPPLAPRRTPTQAAASPSQGPRPSSPAHMLVSAANSASLTFTADSFPFIVKIGDFGLAKDLSAHFEADLPASSAAPNVSTSPFLPSSNQRSAQKGPVRLVGTKTYASPEQLAGSSVLSTQTDMYSLGVILFEMFFVFGTAMERARVLSELRTRRSLPAGFEAEYPAVARLVLWLLQERPEARPSAAELLCDPFVRQYAPSHAPHLTPPLQPSRGALFGTPSTPVGGATSAQLSTMSHDELVAAVQSRDQMIDQMQAMMRKQQEELDALRSRMS
jgi:serine/threonine protein kinase